MATATYTECVAGVMKRLQKVKGLSTVLDYEPQSIHKSPTAMVLYDSHKPVKYSDVIRNDYSLIVRVVVARADNEGAEKILKGFVDAVPLAIWEDQYLDGLFAQAGVGGGAFMHPDKDAVGVFLNYGKTLYRGIDFFVLVKSVTS